MMAKRSNWDEFVTANLLRSRLVDGVVLTTHQGVCVYSYGTLQGLSQENWAQFSTLFKKTSGSNQSDAMWSLGFQLTYSNGTTAKFKPYQKTYCSVYCTSEGDLRGLLVCNLPHGILLASYRHPVTAGQAITATEQFCDLLRA